MQPLAPTTGALNTPGFQGARARLGLPSADQDCSMADYRRIAIAAPLRQPWGGNSVAIGASPAWRTGRTDPGPGNRPGGREAKTTRRKTQPAAPA